MRIRTFDSRLVQSGAARVAAVVVFSAVASQANAASVLTEGMTTAITGGMGDVKDTVVQIIGIAFPYVLAISAILMSPRIVKGLMKVAGK